MQTYKLLEQDHVLLSQPVLIEHFGRAGAQFLSQLHYWLQHCDDIGKIDQGIRWIYNSAQQWAEQLRIGSRQIQRITKKFTDLGIIQVQKLNDNKYNRTNYYTIDYTSLQKHLGDQKPIKPAENSIATFCRNASRQDDVMYIQRLHNKDLNKSEDQPEILIGQEEPEENQVNPVEQVKKDILELEKNKKENPNPRKTSTNQKPSAKTSTAQDMLKMWNDALGEKANAIMSKDLAPLLVSAYSAKFGRDLTQWKRYCELIGTSEYLMKETFDLSIFWALKFSIIDRLRAGGLGVKPEMIKQASVLDNVQIEEMIEKLDELAEAKALRRNIAQVVGAAAYYSWFHQASFVEKDEEILLIAPTTFIENKWEELFPWVNKRKTL